MKLSQFLEKFSENDKINHEMALEAGIISQISIEELGTVKSFGEWDFINHQVIASPFKPIDYIDKMDIFGYKKIKGFPTISKYFVIELKKGKVMKSDLNQLLKYVDWISHNYVSNNYGMIEFFLVGYEFEQDLIEEVKK